MTSSALPATASPVGESGTRIVAGFRVRPIPATSPGIISADEAWHGTAPYSQDALALDFGARLDEEDFGPQPTRRLLLPDPAPLVPRLAQTIIEVVSGQRPAPQLIRHTAPAVYSVLARQAMVAGRRRAGGALRAPVVRQVRLCEPADGVVEACAVVVAHGKVRALALRLEGLDGRWMLTALTIG
ncbi:MAG: Rv3235 family protein [Humibacillus sp.]